MAESLTIALLGEPQVWRAGQLLQITRRKSRALLYYLAALPAPVSRERVLLLLWPDLERAAAQQTLRTTIHGLRQSLGDALLTEGDTLGVLASVDSRTLEQTVQTAPDTALLADTLERYRGDFLSNVELEDAAPFEHWVTAQRERYRRLMVRGLDLLARRYQASGQVTAARDALDRAITIEPLQEDLHRAAMVAAYRAGDRVGAIRRYEQLEQALEAELGVPPVSETRAIYDAIITDTLPAAAAPATAQPRVPAARIATAPTLPLVGRDTELAAVLTALAPNQTVLVLGEPGIGKTRLAAEAVARLGGPLLSASARELDQGVPYQPLIAALRSAPALPPPGLASVWRQEVARLLPELSTEPPPALPPDEVRLREALAQLFAALGQEQPVTLLLDDAHWADSATIGMLGYLIRRQLGGVRLLLTAWPPPSRTPLAQFAQSLERDGLLTRVQLSRLTIDALAALVRHTNPSDRGELTGWLMERSEGNPYIAVELLRQRAQHNEGVPPGVAALVQMRLAGLSDSARRVLDAAAAAGREFNCTVVARAAALSEDAALDALDQLRDAGLIQPVSGERYAFDHTLTLEIARASVGDARHQLLQRRVAEALAVQPDPALAGQIAAHYLAGGAADLAAPYALTAGNRAVALAAWEEAITFFDQALQGGDQQTRPALLLAIGDAADHLGLHGRAEAAIREALALSIARDDSASAAQARIQLGWSLMAEARFAEIIALVADLTEQRGRVAAQAELMWGTALSVQGADLEGAVAHLQRAASLCATTLDLPIRAQVSFELGGVLAQQGDIAAAVVRYREALAAADAAGTALSHRILARNNLAYHLLLLRDPAALQYAEQGLALARTLGTVSLLPFLYSTRGEIALADEELDEAEHWFAEGLALAQRTGMRERIAGLTANLGLVAQRRDEGALAEQRFGAAQALADELDTRHLAAQIRIWRAALHSGPRRTALLAEARQIAERGGRARLLQEIAALGG